ncbi:glycoside hydrolase superfamily [Lasiosphaeris hirsuta]|uniref:Glycoside hydrolase superfamily n=1 Tax=Lasiosphaeris hirsuta TaxID=260670 RepID=A0AA40DMM5_9PEZI|nr:glycoside hydrolase superfamily [Lasiosphaeris hirsuta]
MRFRDGQWLPAEGVRCEYAEEVYRVTETPSGKGIGLLCPAKKIMSRGDVLNLSTLSIEIEAAFGGVISVETTHWQGAIRRGPDFDLFPAGGRPDVSAAITKSDKGTTLSAGSLSATVSGKPHEFEISFHASDKSSKKPLTTLLNRFWLSSRGYGVFVDTPERVELEIGSERCCRAQTSVEGSGSSGGVPAWSFGLWLSTSFTTSYDEEAVNSFLTGMKARDIPAELCDFVFDDDMFPDPKCQIARLKAEGTVKKVCVWTNPYLGQASPVFAEAAEKGYLLKRKNGDVFQWDVWQAGMGIIDFTNPAAIKTDFSERIPSQEVLWFDTTVDPARMHNYYYAFIYNKLVYEALLRAMCIEFPGDPIAWTLDRQFMLGESLLVAPVFEEDGSVQFYLPQGRWTNFFTGEVKAGPGWVTETHTFVTLPLYVRENTLLVLGKEGEKRTVYDYAEHVEVRSYFGADGTWRWSWTARPMRSAYWSSRVGRLLGRRCSRGNRLLLLLFEQVRRKCLGVLVARR